MPTTGQNVASVVQGAAAALVVAGVVNQKANIVSAPKTANVGVMIGGGLLFTASTAVRYLQNYWHEKRSNNFFTVFGGLFPLERAMLIQDCAAALAERYHCQIDLLHSGSKGIEIFAECVSMRIIEYVTSDAEHHQDNDNSHRFLDFFKNLTIKAENWLREQRAPEIRLEYKPLFDIIIDGVTLERSRGKDKIREELPLARMHREMEDSTWNSIGILEHTGIVEGEAFYANPQCHLDTYGFCLGTERQARNQRRLTTIPTEQEAKTDWERNAVKIVTRWKETNGGLGFFQKPSAFILNQSQAVPPAQAGVPASSIAVDRVQPGK